MDGLDEALREFLAECDENLDRVDRDLVVAEGSAPDRATIDEVFRAVHTIKGTCAFLGFPALGAVSHAGENLLGAVRDGRCDWSPAVAAALLRLTGALRSILRGLAAGAGEGPGVGAHALLIDELDRLRDARPAAVGPAPTPAAPVSAPGPPARGGHVRVEVELLDTLMDLVGELSLARDQILHPDGDGRGAAHRLDRITSALRDGVMRARLQPIGRAWGGLPRLVRDLADACGRRVRLETSGEPTALDRAIVGAIRDPLTHLIRNAVGHGIEPPDRRRATGKPEAGAVRLAARHQDGRVLIEVSDDGAGIDPAAIGRRAVALGLVAPAEAARMPDRALVRLIFLPGFSTADRVTSVSGRGVGMDVVRTDIEAIGGDVDVESTPGLGTTIRIRLPLTLAIVPALIVEADGDAYALPRSDVVELARPAAFAPAETVGEAPVWRHRGRLLPLVDLAEALGVAPPAESGRTVAVVRAGGREYGLAVSSVLDVRDVVVKPLGRALAGLPQYAGATILGDGRIALILDVAGLARAARLAETGPVRAASPAPAASGRGPEGAPRRYLVVRAGASGRLAIPLERVERIETLSCSAIESSGGREVVQYRGGVLPLYRPAGASGRAPDGRLRLVVHRADSGPIGLVVDAIDDVMEGEAAVRRGVGAGTGGATILRGRIADVFDPAAAGEGG